MIKKSILIILITVISSSFTLAQDDQGNVNDPNINDRANACYEDGSLAGKCSDPASWTAGWYLIRYEYGIFSRDEVPVWVLWVLPPEAVPEELEERYEPGPQQGQGRCIPDGDGSVYYTGTPNVNPNIQRHRGSDCNDFVAHDPYWIILSGSDAEVWTMCVNIFPGTYAILPELSFGLGAGYYECLYDGIPSP